MWFRALSFSGAKSFSSIQLHAVTEFGGLINFRTEHLLATLSVLWGLAFASQIPCSNSYPASQYMSAVVRHSYAERLAKCNSGRVSQETASAEQSGVTLRIPQAPDFLLKFHCLGAALGFVALTAASVVNGLIRNRSFC